MDSPVAAYPTPNAVRRISSLRATSGNRVYKLNLVDKVNQPSNSATLSSTIGLSTPDDLSSPVESRPSLSARERRKNRTFRMSLAIPKAPPPTAASPVEQDTPSAAPDLFVSPKPPKVSRKKTDSIISDDPTDFLTMLAAKQRRVLELRDELGKAESDLKELQKQWSTHEDRTRRSVQLQAITGGALQNVRPRTSLDNPNPPPQMSTITATASTTTATSMTKYTTGSASGTTGVSADGEIVSSGANAGRLLAGSFPFPSPPKTAPSGRTFAPRSSSLNESVLTPESAKTNAHEGIVSPSNDDFEYDDDLQNNNVNIPIRADEVIHMGRKLAEGLNSHFWNFYEDIKQAAIGDDLILDGKSTTSRPTDRTSLDWRRSRTLTSDSRQSASDYVDDENDNIQRSPSPPIRRISSFMNSPVRNEPLGVDSPEYRGSPQSKHRHTTNGDYSGYSVLHEMPAGASSTSLIDFESSEDELAPAQPDPVPESVQSRIAVANKRFSLYGAEFDMLNKPSLFP
ncbi:hypothetical protein V1512DRAFT_255763 [Lipomyces arxii]|uniref:uncharacterized protein n=1 Tax=Lipomyces arxii TaxID=56418 RepID=UPI0034CEDA8D